MHNIYVFLISMLVCCVSNATLAQNAPKPAKDSIPTQKNGTKKDSFVKSLGINGFTIQVDAASLVSSAILGDELFSSEAALQLNMNNKYFPILEIGYANVSKSSFENVDFKTNGLFGRIGVDFNLKKKNKDTKPTNNLILLGLKLGFTNSAYDYKNIIITDNYWGGTESVPYSNITGLKAWYEITFGIKVEVFKNTFMGWSVRNKHLITQTKEGEIGPWYIPGYGKNTSSNWGINYLIGYNF